MEKNALFGKFGSSPTQSSENHSSKSSGKTNNARLIKDWLADSGGQLALDVYQSNDAIIVKATIAGVNSDDIDISITNDMLTIKGIRAKEEEVKNEDYYYRECHWGSFSRSLILPIDVDAERIKARLKNGILTIILPKQEKAKTTKISVDD